jgi:hypothetical protein
MIGMGAKSITIVRAVTADFFFDCRAAEVHNHAQDLKLESFQSFNVGGVGGDVVYVLRNV